MTKLTTALNKLEKLGISVKKVNIDITNFYYFTINSKSYEFSNQPAVSNGADCLCRTFDNGSSPSFYASMAQLIRMA